MEVTVNKVSLTKNYDDNDDNNNEAENLNDYQLLIIIRDISVKKELEREKVIQSYFEIMFS